MKITKHRLELSEEEGIEASFEASNHRPNPFSTMHFNADSATSARRTADSGEGREPSTSLPRSTSAGSTSSPRFSKMRPAILVGIGICVLAAVGVGLVMQERKNRSDSFVAAASAASSADSDIPLCSELGVTVPPTTQPPSNAPSISPTKAPLKMWKPPYEDDEIFSPPIEDNEVQGILQARAPSPPPSFGHSTSDRNDSVWLGDTWAGDDELGGRELRGRKVQVVNEDEETTSELETLSSTNQCLSDEGKLVTFDPNTDETIEVTDLFLLCRQDPGRPGYGLPEYDRDYPQGEPVYSTLTQKEAGEKLSEDLAIGSAVLGAAGAAATLAAPPLGAALALGSAIFQLVSLVQAKNERDPLFENIQQEFQKTNNLISALSTEVSAGFRQIRVDLADAELDGIMESIQAMQYAYTEMQQVVELSDASVGLKRLYADRYRETCHVPHYKPEDIFRNLYGYACGDKGANRDCNAVNGADTGTCKYGVKKRQFILDILKEDAQGRIDRFESAANWLKQAMLLAQFHYATCLPLEETSCLDPYTDPIRKSISEDQSKAFGEVFANIDRTVKCFKDITFRDTLQNREIYFKEIAENGNCLNNVQGEKEQNKCIAEATRNYLLQQQTFNDKDWNVIVFNFGDSSHKDAFKAGARNRVTYECPNSGEDYGCVMVEDIGELSNRFILLMYRSNDAQERDYLVEITDGTPFEALGRHRVDLRNDVFQQSVDFAEILKKRVVFSEAEPNPQFDFCTWFDVSPWLPSNCEEVKSVMSREHGYFALNTAHGIPMGSSSLTFATARSGIPLRTPHIEGRTMHVIL